MPYWFPEIHETRSGAIMDCQEIWLKLKFAREGPLSCQFWLKRGPTNWQWQKSRLWQNLCHYLFSQGKSIWLLYSALGVLDCSLDCTYLFSFVVFGRFRICHFFAHYLWQSLVLQWNLLFFFFFFLKCSLNMQCDAPKVFCCEFMFSFREIKSQAL